MREPGSISAPVLPWLLQVFLVALLAAAVALTGKATSES